MFSDAYFFSNILPIISSYCGQCHTPFPAPKQLKFFSLAVKLQDMENQEEDSHFKYGMIRIPRVLLFPSRRNTYVPIESIVKTR